MQSQEVIRNGTSDTAHSIIEGTLTVIAEDGISKLTTKAVSERAEVSTASIHYFFDTKENLLYEAFEYFVGKMRSDMIFVRRNEKDPLKRLQKSIDAFFSPDRLSDKNALVWPQIWIYSGHNKKTERLLHMYSSRMISNFTYDLIISGMKREQARLESVKLCAMMHGLWMEKKFGKSIKLEECNQIINAMVQNYSKAN